MKPKKLQYAIIENLAMDAFIYWVFFLINPLQENFLYMNIHPLLIVVTLTALRYGNYIGVISALMAFATYLLGYLSLGRDLYLFIIDFNYIKFFIMFFLSAVIFGRFKDNFDFQINNKNLEYELLQEKQDVLNEEHEKLKFIKEELRKQIVGAEHSITSLYEIASSLETLNSEDIYTQVMHILTKFLKTKTISIYTVDSSGKYLRLKLKKGEDKIIPNSIKAKEHPSFADAINKKVVTKNKDGSGPLMIGPIIKDNKVIAVINIESMDFNTITEYSYNLFKIIVDWISKALVQALEVEGALNSGNFFKETNVMKYKFFENRLKEEQLRREKFDMDYALIKFNNLGMSLEDIDRTIGKIIREVDIGAYDESAKVVHILLPATSIEQSLVVKERFVKESNNILELISNGYT